jgi:tRNA(Leu) C34 or U34 (ribose-2'-O)-methylase TrmL
MRGFAAVGLFRPKDTRNVGAVLRAAHCYNVAMLAIQGDRTPITSQLDVSKAYRHIPVIRGNNLFDLIPFDTIPIAVDIIDGAIPLPRFVHPERAFYIFGPEDGTLGEQHTKYCKYSVYIPTKICLNLAMAVNVVLYDRLLKGDKLQIVAK